MKFFLTCIIFLFSSSIMANDYPYTGDMPLLPERSKEVGINYEYMRLCAGDMFKSAEKTRKEVKELSTPDYNLLQKYRMLEFSKNYSGATYCKENRWLIDSNENYLAALKSTVDNILNNKGTSSYLEKKQYSVCVDLVSGEYSLKDNPNWSVDQCLLFEKKSEAQKFIETSNTKLAEEKREEEERLEEEKRKEQERLEEEKRLAEEKRKEQERLEEEKRLAEEKRKEQERLEEEKRLAEEKRKEQERLEEERRIAEEKRLAEEKILNRKISMIPSESELQLAIEFLQNIETFVKNNPEEFDIIDITELVINTKPILDSNWTDQLKIDFDYLKEFVEQSAKFNEFKKNYDQEKLDRNIKQVDLKIDLLEKNINYLKNYLRENVTSEFAKSILELIKIAESTLNDSLVLSEFDSVNSSIDDLKNEIKEIENLLVNLNNNALKLSEYLQENMTSDLAPEVIQLIKKTETVKEGGKSSVEISDVNNEVVNFIKKHIEKEILPNIKTDKTFGPGSQTGTDDETIISTNSTVTKGITLPQDQLSFINVVERSKTKKWEDEFELGDILQNRNKNLESIINFDKYIVGYDTKYAEIKNWIGVVTERASNSEGKGELYIDIVYFDEGKKSETVSFELRTSNNEFSDLLMGAETLIDPEEKMYDQMRKVKKKDIVIFSGSFFKVDGVIATNDLTKKTRVKKPSFLFKFNELEKFSLTNNNQ